MNERQKRFVDEYITCTNATEAARRAGYSSDTARTIGAKLLTKVDIREAIDARLKEIKTELTMNAQEVLEHLSAVVRGQVTETVISASGKKFVVPVKESDRLKAADMLLKVFGKYREQVDVQLSGSQLFVQTLEQIWAKVEREKTT